MTDWIRGTGFGCLALCLAACASTTQSVGDHNNDARAEESFSFAVIGDIPYNGDQKWALNNIITPKLKEFPFVVHVGDTKAGNRAPCTDALDDEHLAWMGSAGAPVFYTPGDNEWTDCDRQSNAPVVRELLRLEKLRAKFFSPPTVAAPASWRAEWQSGQPENASWVYENVRFATIHLVSSNNGRTSLEPCASTNPSDCDTPTAIAAAVAARDSHNGQWVTAIFAKARAENASAVVIGTQADIYDVRNADVDCVTAGQKDCDGFKEMRTVIAREAALFDKPVLFMHGDSSPYCWDKKFGGAAAPNLWRLNVAGDYVLIDAVKVTVSPAGEVPFAAKGIVTHLTPTEKTC